MKLRIIIIVLLLCVAGSARGAVEGFAVKPFTGNEFRAFIEIFSEMRGPLRKQMLKDSKTDFADADPLNYIMKVQSDRDVKRMLKKHDMSWDEFTQLTGNILLAYYTIQPQMTKSAIVRRLADYGLMLADDEIPSEYRPLIEDFIRTDTGAAVASIILDMILQVPPQNIEIVRSKKITLDKLFYTKYWRDYL